jgi:hypothetical protein
MATHSPEHQDKPQKSKRGRPKRYSIIHDNAIYTSIRHPLKFVDGVAVCDGEYSVHLPDKAPHPVEIAFQKFTVTMFPGSYLRGVKGEFIAESTGPITAVFKDQSHQPKSKL